MASSLRLPAVSLLSATRTRPGNAASQFYPAALSQCRPFSQTPKRRSRGVAQKITMKAPAQPSNMTRGKTATKADLPQDMGLLPGTFVRPLWKDMPSIFEMPRERLRMEWLWIKSTVQNFIGVVAHSKWFNKDLPLRLKERRIAATILHRRMYRAFAAGDTSELRKICCSGLAKSLVSRIYERPENEAVSWNLDEYIRDSSTYWSGVRVLSDRASQVPNLPDSSIRQVVLRITSRQTTKKVPVPVIKKKGLRGLHAPVLSKEESKTTIKQQDCTEYLVIQKITWAGQEEDWRIWGHTTPTTVEDLDSPYFASGLSLSDRMAAMQNMMTQSKK